MKIRSKALFVVVAVLLLSAAVVGVLAWRNRERWVIADHGAVRVRGDKVVSTVAHASWTKLPFAMSMFEIDTGKPVTRLTDLLTDPGLDGWNGPYADSLDDMWGTRVKLDTEGDASLIRSAGRDKVFNTDDDATVK